MARTSKGLPTPASIDAANRLLDIVIGMQRLKNDAALCRFLEVAPPVVSKLRHGHFHMSGDMKIIIHEKTDMPIKHIQSVLAGEENIA